jgi:hypothetical protein
MNRDIHITTQIIQLFDMPISCCPQRMSYTNFMLLNFRDADSLTNHSYKAAIAPSQKYFPGVPRDSLPLAPAIPEMYPRAVPPDIAMCRNIRPRYMGAFFTARNQSTVPETLTPKRHQSPHRYIDRTFRCIARLNHE